MAQMTVSTHVAAPQEQVFAVLADLERAPERIDGIKSVEILTDGPVGAGTRWRETRTMFKRDATEEMEIAAFDPPNGYDVTCDSCGCTITTEMRCVPDGDGTRVSMAISTTANTFFAKLMAPMGWLMKGSMRKILEKDLADLKAAAESA